ncbi:MAG: hypothetical protein GZ086_10200 [Gelidibacter sp.]|nr:hypothetical protein [Gelidibacter sp.]
MKTLLQTRHIESHGLQICAIGFLLLRSLRKPLRPLRLSFLAYVFYIVFQLSTIFLTNYP